MGRQERKTYCISKPAEGTGKWLENPLNCVEKLFLLGRETPHVASKIVTGKNMAWSEKQPSPAYLLVTLPYNIETNSLSFFSSEIPLNNEVHQTSKDTKQLYPYTF